MRILRILTKASLNCNIVLQLAILEYTVKSRLSNVNGTEPTSDN